MALKLQVYSPWNSPGQNTGVGSFPFSRGSSQPRDQTQVSCIAGGFLPAEPQGKPKNTGVGSLSLLQRIFLTLESNQGLLYCRQILYQLSYQGSPFKVEEVLFILKVRKIPLLRIRDISLRFFLCYSIPGQIGNISMVTIILMHTFNTVQSVTAAEKHWANKLAHVDHCPGGAYHLSHV